MTLHTKSLAGAAGMVVLCLLPSFAQAAETNETDPLAMGACLPSDIMATTLHQHNYRHVITLHRDPPNQMPMKFHLMAQPDSMNWVLIREEFINAPCVGDKGTSVDYLSQEDELFSRVNFDREDEISPSNEMCEPIIEALSAAVEKGMGQTVSLHAINNAGADIYIMRDRNRSWSMSYFIETPEKSKPCHGESFGGQSSNFKPSMREVFGIYNPGTLVPKNKPEDMGMAEYVWTMYSQTEQTMTPCPDEQYQDNMPIYKQNVKPGVQKAASQSGKPPAFQFCIDTQA